MRRRGPRQPSLDQLALLETIVRKYPAGVTTRTLIEAYEKAHGRTVLPRTMQRWLRMLRAQGHALAEGKKRARIIYPRVKITPDITMGGSLQSVETVEQEGISVPLSREGMEVLFIVRQPRAHGRLIDYTRRLLDHYQPGHTWYLPETTRQRLHRIGATSDHDREAGTYLRAVFETFLGDLAWASSRLDGNTYSRLDVMALLRYGQVPEGKTPRETRMILNHRTALATVLDRAEESRFDRKTICELHRQATQGLVGESGNEGRIRTGPVGISGSAYRPLEIPERIEEDFDRFVAMMHQIPDPFEQAFFMLVHLSYLHPFVDANKRTARLATNFPLIQANLCPLSFIEVPTQLYAEAMVGIYELRQVGLLSDLFLSAYERSCTYYGLYRDSSRRKDLIGETYQGKLQRVVQTYVREGILPTPSLIQQWAETHDIPRHDVVPFVEQTRTALLSLHTGAVGQYRVLPDEFIRWQQQVAVPVDRAPQK